MWVRERARRRRLGPVGTGTSRLPRYLWEETFGPSDLIGRAPHDIHVNISPNEPFSIKLQPKSLKIGALKPGSLAERHLRGYNQEIVAINGDGCGGDCELLHRKLAEVAKRGGA